MYNSVEYSIRQSFFREYIKPVYHRQLTGDDCRFSHMPVFKDFYKVKLLLVIQRSQSKVIKNQEVCFSQLIKEVNTVSFESCYFESRYKFLYVLVNDRISLSTGLHT